MTSKRAQEEIVGFVVVVVLVSIIFVIILGFSMNKNPNVQEKESLDIRQFLESIRQVTTDCSLTGSMPSNLKELVGACYSQSSCSSGAKACDALNSTIKKILEASYPTGPEAYIKGYIFSIDFKASSQSKNTILFQKSGNCSSHSYRESDDFFPYQSGQIFINLRLCY